MLSRLQALQTARDWFARDEAVFGYVADEVSGACVYRGDNDPSSPVRCGIGCLIPDELYDPSFENTNITALLFEPTTLATLLDPADVNFYVELQRTHDEFACMQSDEGLDGKRSDLPERPRLDMLVNAIDAMISQEQENQIKRPNKGIHPDTLRDGLSS